MEHSRYSENIRHSKNREKKHSMQLGNSIEDDEDIYRNPFGLGLDLLFGPKLRTGNDRDIQGAQSFISSLPEQSQSIARPIAMADILSESALASQPIITDLINPQKIAMSEGVRDILNNKKGGGDLVFKALQVTPSGSTSSFNALKIVDTWQGEMPDNKTSILAYWVPQGGYVDIPAQPDLSRHPQHVFTPGFSGCSFVIDKMNTDTLRVRHVQGDKEDVEYNNLDIDHGMGMVAAMEFRDYGYHETANSEVVKNTYGSAFLKFNPEEKQWQLHYQKLAAAPNIMAIESKPGGLFSKPSINAKTFISKDMKVTGYTKKNIQ
uniref:hypothetical protein n=1 Tax=Photorhabdus sp. RM322S TaxID=3342825 RepID=UPI0036DB687A